MTTIRGSYTSRDLLTDPVSDECWERVVAILERKLAQRYGDVRLAFCWVIQLQPDGEFRWLFDGVSIVGDPIELREIDVALPMEYLEDWRAYFRAAELPFWATFVMFSSFPALEARCFMPGEATPVLGQTPDREVTEWAWSLQDYATREFRDE